MSNQEPLKNSSKDYLHATIKGGLSAIPFVGGVVSEFFGITVASPLQKRHENWLRSLYEEIDYLKEQNFEYNIKNFKKTKISFLLLLVLHNMQ